MRRHEDVRGGPARIAITAWLLLVGLGSCCPAWTSSDPEALGPALVEILTDPLCTCPTDLDRDRYNVCPETRPMLGTDEQGVTWSSDRILFGLLVVPVLLRWRRAGRCGAAGGLVRVLQPTVVAGQFAPAPVLGYLAALPVRAMSHSPPQPPRPTLAGRCQNLLKKPAVAVGAWSSVT